MTFIPQPCSCSDPSTGCNCLIEGLDTDCIDMTVTGSGTAMDPYEISAEPIIDPNPANVVSCGPVL